MYTVIPRRSTKQVTQNNSFENQQGNLNGTLKNICFTHEVAVKEEENKKVTLRKHCSAMKKNDIMLFAETWMDVRIKY